MNSDNSCDYITLGLDGALLIRVIEFYRVGTIQNTAYLICAPLITFNSPSPQKWHNMAAVDDQIVGQEECGIWEGVIWDVKNRYGYVILFRVPHNTAGYRLIDGHNIFQVMEMAVPLASLQVIEGLCWWVQCNGSERLAWYLLNYGQCVEIVNCGYNAWRSVVSRWGYGAVSKCQVRLSPWWNLLGGEGSMEGGICFVR